METNISKFLLQLEEDLDIKVGELNEIEKARQRLYEQVSSIKIAIENLDKAYERNSSLNQNTTNLKYSKQLTININSMTFEQIIEYILRDAGHPMTSKEMQDKYNLLVTQDKKKERNSFSGMLSITIKKTTLFKRIDLSPQAKSKEFVYGLPSWFEGNKIKDEYLIKRKRA